MESGSSILEKIVARRRERINGTGYAQGLDLPRERQVPAVPFPSSPFLLCEVKRRSPSAGVISELQDPAVQVERYRTAGIRAVSVLTEEDFFGGSLRDLRNLKSRHPDIFFLRKDFLLDPEDIEVSRRAGADGILLIAGILDADRLAELYGCALSCGLRALVEVHNREEIEKIRPLQPDTVGINARNLRDFSVDLLTPVSLSALIDWNPRKIFESGIRREEDAALAFSSGFDGALVGEAVMRKPELLPKLQKMRRYYPGSKQAPDPGVSGSPGSFWGPLYLGRGKEAGDIRPLVKICGLTNEQDVRLADELGADILGFVLAPSPRRAEPAMIRRIGRTRARKVGVVVCRAGSPELPPEAEELLREGALEAIQFHGDENPEDCCSMAFPYYKALRIRDGQSVERAKTFRSPRVLADAFAEGRYGGTGRTIDGNLVSLLRKQGPLWLAGGIGPENVRKIILEHSPELIDASSRLEVAPGKKDPDKLRLFFEEISRAASAGTPKEHEPMKHYKNFFGEFGGRYVAEVLRPPLEQLEKAFLEATEDPSFLSEVELLAATYTGRPTPLLHAENSSRKMGGAQIYIKLEGLASTGAHKINNALGQALLARRMGKRRVIAETGAGQHGVATAAACAKLGLECRVYMGEVDIRRQHPNVFWMEMYGAEVVPVTSGSRTLKDAVNEALRDWSGSFEDTHYLLGSALGPSPYPDMVRFFQSVIGEETRNQIAAQGTRVEALIACVGGGSNAIGFFSPFLEQDKPRLIGVEAGGRGKKPGDHAVRMDGQGRTGIVQGYKSRFLLDGDGQVQSTHSISAGLDYPGIGPQLADLGVKGRVEFTSASDEAALQALRFFAENEGVLFALESAHAGAVALETAAALPGDRAVVVNMSGRGEKDLFITARALTPEAWNNFLKEEVHGHAD